MPKILVVDDNQKVRESFQFALPISGYEVVAASNFTEARKALSNHSIQAIVLDLDLNGESGLVLLKAIRESNIEIPVIIFSGSVTPQIEIELKDAGADEIVDKGYGVLPVVEKIQYVLITKS